MKIKKILIGIVIILIIIILSNVFMMLFQKVATKIAIRQENQVIENETLNEVIGNIVEDNEIQEEIEVEENIQEDEKLQGTQEIKEKQDVEQAQTYTNKQVQASQKDSSNTSDSNNSQNKQTQSTQTPKNIQTTITTTTTQAPKQETVVTSTPSIEVTTQTVGDKEVRNDAMINKIKQVIENNPSENMKKYGYQIVVDSSIKELTNQFTFTESRVINNIKYSFNTIRIYAEDWYKNGTFTMTACYIL